MKIHSKFDTPHMAAKLTAPARVAQSAERLTRNEQVRSSILLSGSHG